VFIENEVRIGDRVTSKSGVYLWDGLTVEDDVFIGPSVAFTNDKFPRSRNSNFLLQKTLIKSKASIGAGAVILPGITIGEGSMVGAGSVVTHNVPDYVTVVGNPARVHSKSNLG
jgi:acetyltransferase-like isoleucine patch superfamily enzyme